jgi:hypothetical protein
MLWRVDPLPSGDLVNRSRYLVTAGKLSGLSLGNVTTIEELLERKFSVRSLQSGYKEDNWGIQSVDS